MGLSGPRLMKAFTSYLSTQVASIPVLRGPDLGCPDYLLNGTRSILTEPAPQSFTDRLLHPYSHRMDIFGGHTRYHTRGYREKDSERNNGWESAGEMLS